MDLITLPFYSENHWQRFFVDKREVSKEMITLGMPDSLFVGNNHFSYPVFIPTGTARFNKAIILLHGLNERFWDKYFPWAYFLASYTNRPVILFPLSFHMNRAPLEWSNPKVMAPLVDIRKEKVETRELTFVNLALSSRLSDDPLRFLRSGYQSAEDLVLLTRQINQGLIPFLEKGTQPDFFAYSIGAFVSQIMLLANPDGIFSDSRFFLFCGGAFFKDMNGVSRLIMDQAAYEKIHTFYTAQIERSRQERPELDAFLSEHTLGKAFYSMLKEDNNKSFREERFKEISKNLYSISLEKDKVIPSKGIDNALRINSSRDEMMETLDFPFEYCHENPFPSKGKADRHIVDYWFKEVMGKAAGFLN
jgi:pimeloyl-ACP methyl ester carboxylesterase